MRPAGASVRPTGANQARKVTLNERGMFALDLDLAGKSEVVADEHLTAQNHRGGKPFVVTGAQAQDVGVIRGRRLGTAPTHFGRSDLEQAEIAATIGTQAVRLVDDPHPGTV